MEEPGFFESIREEMEAAERSEGVHPADLLALPDDENEIAIWLMQHGPTLPEDLAAELEMDEVLVQTTLEALRRRGYVRHTDDGRALLRLAPKRPSALLDDFWETLSEKLE